MENILSANMKRGVWTPKRSTSYSSSSLFRAAWYQMKTESVQICENVRIWI